MLSHERRAITGELRADTSTRRLTGYAALYNVETEIAGFFRERIAPGAFEDAVQTDDVRALFNHDPNFVLGRTSSGTLQLSADHRGLRYDVEPPDTQWARDLMVSVDRGDVTQSSFGFVVPDGGDEWTREDGKLPLRTIRKAQLYDVSPVTFPAYAETTVSARAQAQAAATVVPPAETESRDGRQTSAAWSRWLDAAGADLA